jgi:PAS domain S-box-containing protein
MIIMLADVLQDRAALYVSGEMNAPDREAFAVLLEFHDELRSHVAVLQEAMAGAVVSQMPVVAPPAGLKARLLAELAAAPEIPAPDALVVANPDGLIEWINPAFTALCGYELAELKGRKPGELLQGAATDRVVVERMRGALRERRPCRETLVNYHKDGSMYRADIRITPILDDEGQPLYFVAQERKLQDGDAVLAG